MSCHDWRRLLAHRFEEGRAPDPGWEEAERHLESCAKCREEALTLDPTLGFRRAGRWTPEAPETEAVRHGVHTLLRTGRWAAGGDPGRSRPGGGRARLASLALFALLLAMLPGGTAEDGADSELARLGSEAPPVSVEGATAPAIEGLDRPGARVYEWGGDDLSVVMVVDESLDV